MSRFIQTKRGKTVYKIRQRSAESAFGQSKAARGFRSFSLRDLANVSGEWNLVALVHNLLKVFRHKCAFGGSIPRTVPTMG
jgi:hypothetical protein